MIARAAETYPFPLSPHTLWILQQLIETPRSWNLERHQLFYVSSFSEKFPASIETDYYTYEILRHLESRGFIEIQYGDKDSVREYSMPIPEQPKHRMVAKWLVNVKNAAAIVTLYNKIVYRLKVASTNSREILHCHFYISEDAVLWIESEIGHYPLRPLQEGRMAYKVLSTLFQTGVVELNEKGEIKGSSLYAETHVSSLQDALHGVGFDKILKDKFFLASTKNKIEINLPSIRVHKALHSYLLEHFEEVSKIRQNINSARMQKRKSLQNYRLNLSLERDT